MSIARREAASNPIRLHIARVPDEVFAGVKNGPYYESLLGAISHTVTPREGCGYYPWEMFGAKSAASFERGMQRVKRWSGALSPADGFVDDNLSHTKRMLADANYTIARLPADVIHPHSLRMKIAVHDAGEIVVGDLPTSPFDPDIHREHKAREVAAVVELLVPRIASPQVQEVVEELYLLYINRGRLPLAPDPSVATAHVTKFLDLLDARRVLIKHGARDTTTGQTIPNPRGTLGRKLSSQSLDEHLQRVLDCTEERKRPAVQDVLEGLLQL